MAVLWSKRTENTLYEVRSAGNTVRLYSNGVLHSQYNPKFPISGAIWDLLLLPSFSLETAPKRILILGLGGGTLLHTIRYFFPHTHITCVELDKQHIHIAQRWFKIPLSDVEIVHGDAYEFLASTTQQFDWVVDDVFQHSSGDPQRTFSLLDAAALYSRVMLPNGVLTLNLIGAQQLKQAKQLMPMINYAHGLLLTHPLYDNRILSFLPDSGVATKEQARQIKQRFNAHKELNQNRKSCRLNYRMRWLTS